MKSAARFASAAALALVIAACSDDTLTGPGIDPSSSAATAKKRPRPPADTTTSSSPTVTNPFAGAVFYVDPYSNARQTADAWYATRPDDAKQMEKIAQQSQARWFGRWNADVAAAVRDWVSRVSSAGAMPVLVAYNMYKLDCTSGGASSPDGYRSWISSFASALGGTKTAVVLEPDAIAQWGCLSSGDRQTRADLIRYAIETLKARPLTYVYVDAGHPRWQTATEIANRLTSVGVSLADGFSLNVSNFITTSDNVTYGKSVSSLIGGKHFVIDTGRNGLGPTSDYQWCNPDGRAIGTGSTAFTVDPLVDAYLWIKPPGESDGTCNGGPSAGAWWADYALGLAQRS